jgi:hypothetical protein
LERHHGPEAAAQSGSNKRSDVAVARIRNVGCAEAHGCLLITHPWTRIVGARPEADLAARWFGSPKAEDRLTVQDERDKSCGVGFSNVRSMGRLSVSCERLLNPIAREREPWQLTRVPRGYSRLSEALACEAAGCNVYKLWSRRYKTEKRRAALRTEVPLLIMVHLGVMKRIDQHVSSVADDV